MDFDFKKVMSERTDEELIKIVTIDRDGYQPAAIKIAEEEINRRNPDISTLEQLKEDIETQDRGEKEFDRKQVSSITRFLHYVIDAIIWLIIVALLTSPLKYENGIQTFSAYVIWVLSYLGYYYVMESKYQKTVAKFITKTKVVVNNGNQPTNGYILRRTLCRLIPFDWITYLFTKNGIHDRLSDTTLIKENR